MPVIEADVVTYLSEDVPVYGDDASSSGGDIDTGSGAVSESAPNVLIPTEAVPSVDDAWRYKMFRKNTNGTDTWFGVYAWIYNLLRRNNASGTASIVSTDAAETTGRILLLGKVSGVWTTDSINLNGTTPVAGAVIWDANTIIRAQKLSAGGALVNATGTISILDHASALQGVIPEGYNCATYEFELGLDPTINDTLAATNRLTNPVGVTFGRPYSVATSTAVPGDDLGPGDAIGYWLRFNRYADVPGPVGYIRPVIAFQGRDAA